MQREKNFDAVKYDGADQHYHHPHILVIYNLIICFIKCVINKDTQQQQRMKECVYTFEMCKCCAFREQCPPIWIRWAFQRIWACAHVLHHSTLYTIRVQLHCDVRWLHSHTAPHGRANLRLYSQPSL